MARIPDDVVAMNRLGRAYEGLEALDRAESALRQAVAADPNNANRLRGLLDLARR